MHLQAPKICTPININSQDKVTLEPRPNSSFKPVLQTLRVSRSR